MKKTAAFTLIEVMISIFIFSTAMIGYMAFHAHSMSVLFDNESAQFAHAIAFNLVDEMNAIKVEDFKTLIDEKGNSKFSDTVLKQQKYLGTDFGASPFYLTDAQSYKFNRYIQILPYTEVTGVSVPKGSFLSYLYQIEITVYWPKRGFGSQDCTDQIQNFETKCNQVVLHLVRSDKRTFNK